MNQLTRSQQCAFDAYLQGRNLFVSGDAGTGKSFTVKEMIQDAIKKGLNVLVVAPTGKAAKNVGGMTIHSAFRAPIGITGPEDVFKGKTGRDGRSLLELADLIVIDEISMVRYDLFAGVRRSIAAAEEKSKRHKQVIVVGDFFQLPPVLADKEDELYHKYYGDNIFAFQGGLLEGFTSIKLTEKLRQKDDAGFAEILDRLREGDTSVLSMLPVSNPCGKAVTLCALNRQADSINAHMLEKLKDHRVYTGQVIGKVSEDDMFAPKNLEIAPGARVLLTVNDSDGRWINGSEADVVECRDDEVIISIGGNNITCGPVTQVITETEIIEEMGADGKTKMKPFQKEVGRYIQFPFKLGWAISIHKSQGMTLEEVNIDPSGCFAHGQLYVALSRCKSLQGIHLTRTPIPEHLICFPVVKDFMTSLPDYGVIGKALSPVKERSVSEPSVYPVKKPAGQSSSPQETMTATGRSPLPAKKHAGIRDIEKMIYDSGFRLLLENELAGYSLWVKVLSEKTSPTSPSEGDIEARKAAKSARMTAANEKLKTVDDAGIRQQLSLMSLDAQEVYHLLRDRAVGGNVAATADAITEADGVTISKRSVENALQELRDAGLTSSIGSKKKPVIHLTETMLPSNASECLLYRAAHSNKEIRRMQSICGQCEQICPVHSNPEV